MNIKIKNQHGEWVEAAYTLDGDDLLVEPKVFIPQNGDVVVSQGSGTQIMICKSHIQGDAIEAHIFFDTNYGKMRADNVDFMFFNRRATEKEKILLFNKMKEEGYEWDAEKKEVRKIRWKPKYGDTYFRPRYDSCDDLFCVLKDEWEQCSLDHRIYRYGWCFQTKEECQSLCDKLNEAIRKFQSCESNDTK